jgi:hypothetical protein
MEDINKYFNTSEKSEVGSTDHSGGWSKDYQDPDNYWGHGNCFVYYNRNCSFKLKQEIWHGHTSKIVRVKDMELLTNETPFTDAEVLEALNEKWFALGNENIRLANNAGARMRRAKQQGVA